MGFKQQAPVGQRQQAPGGIWERELAREEAAALDLAHVGKKLTSTIENIDSSNKSKQHKKDRTKGQGELWLVCKVKVKKNFKIKK